MHAFLPGVLSSHTAQLPILSGKPLQTLTRHRLLGPTLSCFFTSVVQFTRPWIAS
jgi:hypothetical protein